MPKKTKKGRMKEEASASEAQSKEGPRSEEGTADKNVQSCRTLSLKAKLEVEKKNSAANMLKVNEGWTAILRQTQDPEQRQHIMKLQVQFEMEVDGLDSTIKDLECRLLKKERRSARVRRAHQQNMESLCALQDKQLNLVQQPWEDCMQHISSEFNSQKELMLQESQQQEERMEDVMSFMEGQHKAVMEDMQGVYQITTQTLLYEEMEHMGQKQAAMKEEEPMEEPKEKPRRDNIMSGRNTFEEINKDMKEIMRMKELLMKGQNKISTKEDLRAQQQQERLRLHNELAQAQKDGRKRLTDLTIQSSNSAKKLQAVIAKGERLLHVGEVCQKLESKLEKASAISFSTGPEIEEPAKEVSEIPELRQLTQHLNDVTLQRETLKKHKVELKQENEQLKLQLREHLDDMILSNNTFNRPDAPLTVHRAPNTNTPNTRAPTANTPTTTKK